MTPLTKLLIAAHNGEVDIKDLTVDQQEVLLDGYRQLANRLLKDPAFVKAGEQILEVLDLAGATDPFDSAITDAESRGSTYWDLETNSIH
jgi:hypothetical protein